MEGIVMNKFLRNVLITVSVLVLSSCLQRKPVIEEFSFIVAADWRYFATEEYHSSEYFMGALEAMKDVGPGEFMISPGDVEPVDISDELIKEILGENYTWYPVIGNHEADDRDYVETLRAMNRNGNSLPNIVNSGPPGAEETMFSFDYGDFHFIIVNQYYDGVSDMGTDGNLVPETMAWLRDDLERNARKYIFVIGHEPLVSLPDMDNGRIRHVGDSLDQYARNANAFRKLLLEFGVVAYICGHTHNTSYGNINGLWQFDCGHARGTEGVFPEKVFASVKAIHLEKARRGLPIDSALAEWFQNNAYSTKKVMYYMDLTNSISYKKLPDEEGYQIFKEFYQEALRRGDGRKAYFQTFWENWSLSKSTFLKMRVSGKSLYVDFYRNDARGGDYSLEETVTLPLD